MTQPTPEAWDGEGHDPWMPQRLQAQAQVAVGERTIYDDYYARLAAWLTFAGQAVLAGVVPNPDAILNAAPRWVRSMTDFVHSSIAEMVGKAYVRVFGPGYRYDNRPYVVDYLARAENRLVDVPEQAYTLVISQIAEGAMAGESIPKIAERVRQSFDVTATPYWRSRPAVVARTETVSALNSGRQGAFQEVAFDLGDEFEHMWLSTIDNRTRQSHRDADGQRVPLDQPFIVGDFRGMFPGAPELPASEVIQCVPGDTVVSFPGLRAATRRWYEGDLIKLSFASGDELSITPNHPVLRADGVWTPAGELNEGDHCVRAVGGRKTPGAPHEDRGPTEIREVYRTAQISGFAKWVAVSPPDFHGDGIDGHVEVVAVDRSLSVDTESASDEQVSKFGLALADAAGPGRGTNDHRPVPSIAAHAHSCADIAHPSLRPHSGGQVCAFVRIEPSHAEVHGLTPASDWDVRLSHAPDNGSSAYPNGLADCVNALAPLVPGAQVVHIDGGAAGGGSLAAAAHANSSVEQLSVHGCDCHAEAFGQDDSALPGLVSTTQIINVERYFSTTHVYNLDTGEGWYIANSIITRNCRCTQLILRPGESIDLSGRQMSDL